MADSTRTTVHEEYAFACLSCGYGWEQAYEIEHRPDPAAPHGTPLVLYYADGRRVPSPLTHPTCPNCDGHHIRVIRSGLAAAAQRAWRAMGVAGNRMA
jgi:hypothetical protein